MIGGARSVGALRLLEQLLEFRALELRHGAIVLLHPHSQKSKSIVETPSWIDAQSVQPYFDISPHSLARATLWRSAWP